ncbi:MAG: NAD(+) diphosphatase [Gammaproteobacteria bacterium]
MKFSPKWFLFRDEHVLILDQDLLGLQSLQPHFIGDAQGYHCYCAELPNDFPLPTSATLIPLRTALLNADPIWFRMIIKGSQIVRWNKNHLYCGQCGSQTLDKTTVTPSFERHCPQCGMIFYPRISPSIIVRIQKNNQILLARSPHFKPGIYSLIAGFIEPGESAEEAVHREIKEEVGIQVKNIRYFRSQPWPFPDALVLGFTAEYAGGELIIDNHEIAAADWYDANHLPGLRASHSSIARQLIDDFLSQAIF